MQNLRIKLLFLRALQWGGGSICILVLFQEVCHIQIRKISDTYIIFCAEIPFLSYHLFLEVTSPNQNTNTVKNSCLHSHLRDVIQSLQFPTQISGSNTAFRPLNSTPSFFLTCEDTINTWMPLSIDRRKITWSSSKQNCL